MRRWVVSTCGLWGRVTPCRIVKWRHGLARHIQAMCAIVRSLSAGSITAWKHVPLRMRVQQQCPDDT